MSGRTITVGEIVSALDCTRTAILDSQDVITGYDSIRESKKHDLAFCSYRGSAGAEMVRAAGASLVICHQDLYGALSGVKSSIAFVKNPRLAFIRCIQRFFPGGKTPAGIHATAVVESSHVERNVHIGPHACIARGVVIGENSVIRGGAVIHGNVQIGRNVMVNSNTVIGKDGFGFERDDHGNLTRFPHTGGVRIHDHVEIGANVTIDRGTIHDTVIGRGSKIDNLVHVAHNVRIGRNCCIVANSFIGGGCIIGENVDIAMTATLREGTKIGSNSLVGMGSVVTGDVPENVVVYGNPARIMRSRP